MNEDTVQVIGLLKKVKNHKKLSAETVDRGTHVSGWFCFIRSSLQGLHIADYHTVSCLLAPVNKKEKTYIIIQQAITTACCADVSLAQ